MKKLNVKGSIAVGLGLLATSSMATAKSLSEMFIPNVTKEAGAFTVAIIFIAGLIGLIFFMLAFFEFKKQRSESGQNNLRTFWTYIIVGIGLGLVATIYTAAITSATGEEVEVQTEYPGF